MNKLWLQWIFIDSLLCTTLDYSVNVNIKQGCDAQRQSGWARVLFVSNRNRISQSFHSLYVHHWKNKQAFSLRYDMKLFSISPTLLYKNSQAFQAKWHHLGGKFWLVWRSWKWGGSSWLHFWAYTPQKHMVWKEQSPWAVLAKLTT